MICHGRIRKQSPTKQTHVTPPKFNIASEKWWLEDYSLSYWVLVTFQGRAAKLRQGKANILSSFNLGL